MIQTKFQVIAEIGSVHDGSFGNACKLIELAARSGANVVKFQTHISSAETLRNAPMPSYFKGEPRYEYFERTAFSKPQWRELREECARHGVEFLSSPFSIAAVDMLEEIGAGIYKVPSGEVSNRPLLEHLGALGKPVLLSSGMSSWTELDQAVDILRNRVELNVMQCTSAYPCPPERTGLNVLAEMRRRYGDGVTLGFSDHTAGVAAGPAAAALGATVIEKHLTFSRAMYGSDAANALEPNDFALYCRSVREVWTMLEHPVDKDDLTPFHEMKRVFEKSVVAARPIAARSAITRVDLDFKKPGDGIPAADYESLIGRRTRRDIPADHKFCMEDFE
jgi:N,N'-diacetyllegionaminate synthase